MEKMVISIIAAALLGLGAWNLNQTFNLSLEIENIKGKVDFFELSTPLTTRDLANYSKGELYGIEHTPHRFHQRWLRPQTDIKNLYLTGQDVITVGVTSALFSGLLTASSVIKKNLLKELLKN